MPQNISANTFPITSSPSPIWNFYAGIDSSEIGGTTIAESVHANNGTVVGNGSIVSNGSGGGAYQGGNTGYAVFPQSTDYESQTKVTIAVKFKLNSLGKYHQLVAKKTDSLLRASYAMFVYTDNTLNLDIFKSGFTTQLEIVYNTPLVANVWYKFVAIIDTTIPSVHLIKDANEVGYIEAIGTVAGLTAMNSTTDTLKVGGYDSATSSEYVDGIIDYVGIAIDSNNLTVQQAKDLQ